MLATPVLLRRGQSLPAATTPAPGSHTSLHRAACADIVACLGLAGSLRDLFRPGQVSLPARTPSKHLISASRLPDIRMSLSTLVYHRRRSAAASLGMLATPDSFRLNQSPLGAIHLPQAPTTVGHTPSPEGLSKLRVRWIFPRLSPISGPSLSSSRIPKP